MSIEGVTLGEIVTAFAVLMAITKGLDWLISPVRKNREEVNALTKRVNDHDKEMKDIHEYMFTSLTAIKALLKHGIDGNDVDSMKQAYKDIDTYLTRKVKEG